MTRLVDYNAGNMGRTLLRALAIALAVTVVVGVSQDDFKMMKVKELKAFLEKRGADCLACSSKSDFVDRALETRDWPEVEIKVPETQKPGDVDVEQLLKDVKIDDEKMKKLREELEKSGLDTSKLFNGNILNAQELAKVFKDRNPDFGEAGAGEAGKGDASAGTEPKADDAKTEAKAAEEEVDAKPEL